MTRQAGITSSYTFLITGQKGGTGKSTLAALLTEYLTYRGWTVNGVDTDPQKTYTDWISNCSEEGRLVSNQLPTDYQIIDTAGVSGATLGYFKTASIIIVPFISHYADLKVILPWFKSLPAEQQVKVILWPNRWQNTVEQQEGLKQVEKMLTTSGKGRLGIALPHRPALFAPLLNGNKTNFFSQKEGAKLLHLLEQIFPLSKQRQDKTNNNNERN